MGKILGKFLILAAVALGSTSVLAATQFTVSGTTNFTVATGTTWTATPATYKMTVVFDAGVPVTDNSTSTMSSYQWLQSIVSVSYQFFDSSGNPVFTRDIAVDGTTQANSTMTSENSTGGDTAQWLLNDYDSATATTDTARVLFTVTNLFAGTSVANYPDPGLLSNPGGTTLIVYHSPTTFFVSNGAITNVTVGAADSDGDGIADDQDSCPNSDLSSTVTVNGNDTGVTNSLQPNGCTIMDLIAGVSSPRKMAHVLDRLEDNGVITHRDMGKIVRAAAMHHGHRRAREDHSWGHHSGDGDHDHHSTDRDHDHHSSDHDRG